YHIFSGEELADILGPPLDRGDLARPRRNQAPGVNTVCRSEFDNGAALQIEHAEPAFNRCATVRPVRSSRSSPRAIDARDLREIALVIQQGFGFARKAIGMA